MIAAPMFHSWGFAHFTLGMGLGSTLVLRRKFDPEDTLSADRPARVHGARRRAGDAPAHPRAAARDDRHATTSAPCASSPPAAARCRASSPIKVMDRFGDVLYNLYGSTEVAWATIATPEDLRAAPGTAGRPPRGTVRQAPRRGRATRSRRARPGRIFVGNEMVFDGYTGGGNKERHRRADVDRRRRALRRRRAPVRRRPRRRDDRLGRRERLPARGRGPARRPRRGRRGRRHRRRGRASSASACGRSSSSRAGGERRPPRTSSRTTSRRNLARYKVPREIVFLDELPRNATGKVLKRELADK